MIVAAVVPFRDEERFLPTFLASVESQHRHPDRLYLVDDGSADASPSIARAFAARHPWAHALRRPPTDMGRDRLAAAAELLAFQWAVDRLEEPYDVIAKLDADLELPPDFFAELDMRFTADPRLGMAGAHIRDAGPAGRGRRLRCPPGHVQGMTKLYRRECFEDIAPLPPILGWDTIDEARARMRNWRTETFALPHGDVVHLRRMGSGQGVLRGYRRAGVAAHGYGSSPLLVALAGLSRMRDRPVIVAGLNYLAGWLGAAARRQPRAEPRVRAFVRREQHQRVRRRLSGSGG